MVRLPQLLGAAALALAPSVSSAQVTPPSMDPVPTFQLPSPTPTRTPDPLPTPSPVPTPEPTASPTPTPTPTAAPRRPTVAPIARTGPFPGPRTSPTVSTTVSPTPEPGAAPTPTPPPTPTATPAPIETVVVPQATQPAPLWPWLAGGAALSLLAAFLLLRRRAEPASDETYLPEEPPAPAPPATRARLVIALRPNRAGLNLLTATVDGEVTLTNTGDAPAHDIRTAVGLLSAHAGADSDLADLAAQPIGRPTTPPFSLQPGEERRFRAVAALPHDAIRPMTAAGRPMFVPLVAVAIRFRDEVERQVAQAFAVGVERLDSPKLAPLWLDVPPRSYDKVAARPHAAAIER